MRIRKALLLSVLALAAVVTARADSLQLTFDATSSFSGTAISGTFSMLFTGNADGTVTLTIASNLAAGQYLDPSQAIYFNLNPLLTFSDLSFALAPGGDPSSLGAATIGVSEDAYKPDGDGKMDVKFTYNSTQPFAGGESQTYIISYSGGTLTASDFYFLSTCGTGCGTNAHYAAIHVQNTGTSANKSDWNGPGQSTTNLVQYTPNPTSFVPEPGSLVLLGSGLVGLVGLFRRRC